VNITEDEMTATVPPDDAERRGWFAQFGYTGNPNEGVTLIGPDGEPISTVTVTSMWAVRRGLLALKTDYSGQFHRVGNWTEAKRRPMDPANRLCDRAYGPLTSLQTGEWLPGRREIICSLLKRDPDDEVTFSFREQPLVQRKEAPQTT